MDQVYDLISVEDDAGDYSEVAADYRVDCVSEHCPTIRSKRKLTDYLGEGSEME